MEIILGIGIGYVAGTLVTLLTLGLAKAAKPMDFENEK